LPPAFRFPPLREGNRVGRVGSVPPACRGNLKEGVIGHTRFCELWLRDWYDSHQTTIDSHQTTIDSYQTTMDSYQTTMDRRQVNRTAGECSRARRMGRISHKVEARRAVPPRLISRVRVRGDQHPLPKLNSTCSRSASSTVRSQFTSTRPRLLPALPNANNIASRSASSTQPLRSTSPL
jgi:hypothetical protein